MADDQTPTRTNDAPPPAEWDKDEMKFDFPEGEARRSGEDAGESAPDWDKSQVARERPDGTRTDPASEEELGSSVGGLSGNSANPGGGERFADHDRS